MNLICLEMNLEGLRWSYIALQDNYVNGCTELVIARQPVS